ncbi:MAG: hypothetical protein AAB385_05450 [Planctomycetota bacterium]
MGLPYYVIDALATELLNPGGRTGLLHALVQVQGEGRYAVRIGGRAIRTIRGTLVD